MNKIDNFNGTVTKQVVNSRKLNFGRMIRTVTISDLQGYTSNDTRTIRLANTILNQNPDIIFIAGDIFQGGRPWEGGKKFDKFVRFIQIISEVAPVCITWGNHDQITQTEDNKELRISNFRTLENTRRGNVFPLYNDSIFINGMEIIGFVPRYGLMAAEGLKTQHHGVAHDEFINVYEETGVKFENKPGMLNVYLGHDPHLIASAENDIGLGSLSVCDFFIAGHLHDGFRPLFTPVEKIKRAFTGKGLKAFEYDRGYVEHPTGLLDRNGNLIEGSKKLLGPINLCRGIVYIDNDSQQHFLQLSDGSFYRNISKEINVQEWENVSEITARREILDNNYHFLLTSEGVSPSYFHSEKTATINVVDVIREELDNQIKR